MMHYQPVAEDPSLNLQERPASVNQSPEHKSNQTIHNFKPATSYPAVASTSKQQPHNYLDDIQPCSSKTEERYHIA